MIDIRELTNEEELIEAFPVMHQLRPHLDLSTTIGFMCLMARTKSWQ
ncbi:hypothetical protein [Salinicoccus sp. YB14-2]